MRIRIGLVCVVVFGMLQVAGAQQTAPPAQPAPAQPAPVAKTQDQLEADFAKMLTGATLEGSFTSTAPGADPTRLRTDKYTLGTVRKSGGDYWTIEAKIQYRGNETMFPLPIPIKWAGNTPVIVLDNLTIPNMGTFSARVMFYDGHYSGYWKHGDRNGGLMFGVIKPAGDPTTRPTTQPAAQ